MEKLENSLVNLKDLLHPRIVEFCIPLFNNGHFKQAAYESFIHVETALKEKLPYFDNRYTRGLVNFAYKNKNYKLVIPFDDNLQTKAHDYFDSVFAFYRNAVAHESKQIDLKSCIRILIIASELLDMIDASVMPFKGIETVDDLIKKGLYKNRNEFLSVLSFLEGQYFVDEGYDGIFEDLAHNNISVEQYENMFDFGLVTMNHSTAIDSSPWNEYDEEVSFDTFELTALGAYLKCELEKSLE